MNRYPDGLVEWVQAHYLEYDLKELTEQINERFGTSMNAKAVSSMKKRYKLRGAPKARIYSDTFPKEICDFIESHYLGTSHRGMAALLQQNMGVSYTTQQIKAFYRNHHLNSGLTGRFEKGHVSHNKGKKMSPEQYAKCAPTMFKPGNRPHNAMKVGERTRTQDGYWKTKTAEPNVWEFDHKLIWQQYYGEIPKGAVIGFRDSNKDNLDPENLMLISHEEHGFLNVTGMRSNNPEYTDTAVMVARLSLRARELRKKR